LGKSAGTRDQDFLEHMFVATNQVHDVLYAKGKCFWMRVYEIQKEVKLPRKSHSKLSQH
jgi:DNA gyrase subunit A